MGTCCRSKWRENDETERIWVVEPAHPIASGLPEYIEIPQEETYGERFEIPTPDELVFISWFSGGESVQKRMLLQTRFGQNFLLPFGSRGIPHLLARGYYKNS
ncbi:MAG: hypothetical protein L6V93_07230 [Clostridiales bacterium]|nr:MAG: hypothetical protein L6V93_07230 [Clostridiales bacterium]